MEWHKKYSRGVFAYLVLSCPRRYSPCIGVALTLSVSLSAWAAQSEVADGSVPVRFNTAFIQGSDQPPDLQEFLRSNSVLPGTYRVDIYVNRTLSGRRDITFSKNPLSGLIEPCLSLDMLKGFGLDPNRLPADTGPGEACVELPARVEFARVA